MLITIEGGAVCVVCSYVESYPMLCRTFERLGFALCRRCCIYNGCCIALRRQCAEQLAEKSRVDTEAEAARKWADGVFY